MTKLVSPPRSPAEATTEELAFSWFWEAARNLSQGDRARIRRRLITVEEMKSPVMAGACAAWDNYLKFTGGAYQDTDGTLVHPV